MLIDIPVDVTKEDMDFDPDDAAGDAPARLQAHRQGASQADPGGGAASSPRPSARSSTPAAGSSSPDASEELRELALYGHIPVTTTLTGKGCFPEDHDLSMGMLGMHGTPYANYAVSQADLIVAVGVRFDDRVTGKLEAFAPARHLHPRRRRPGRDLQERGRRRAHRGRRQAGAGGARWPS